MSNQDTKQRSVNAVLNRVEIAKVSQRFYTLNTFINSLRFRYLETFRLGYVWLLIKLSTG